MFSAKFFAKDFVGGKIPAVGQTGKIKIFMGMKNAEVKVEQVWAGGCFATLV